MYPIRVDIILFGCVMIHLQRCLMKLCLYKSISRYFPKCILGLSHEFILSVSHYILFWSGYSTLPMTSRCFIFILFPTFCYTFDLFKAFYTLSALDLCK